MKIKIPDLKIIGFTLISVEQAVTQLLRQYKETEILPTQFQTPNKQMSAWDNKKN